MFREGVGGGERTGGFNKKTSGKRYRGIVCMIYDEARINEIVPISVY